MAAITESYTAIGLLRQPGRPEHQWMAHYEGKDKKAARVTTFYTDNVTSSTRHATFSGLSDLGNSGELEPPSIHPRDEIDAMVAPLRTNAIKARLRQRREEFSEKSTISVHVCTWNVNGKVFDAELESWLQPELRPDIFVVGLQEVVDLTAQNLIMTDATRANEWEKALTQAINKVDHYELVGRRQLVGIFLAVFARGDLFPDLSDLRMESVGCGLGGWMGNKGGVGIRFCVHDTAVCFINSHLDADKERVEGRDADMKEISEQLSFKSNDMDGASLGIADHDIVVWFGDLNYRISHPNDDVKAMIIKQNWKGLAALDQLTKQRKLGCCFVGFEEAPLAFAPTYKYDIGTDVYDTSEKHRTPAWCDRVLWKGPGVTCKSYGRAELMTSDHRPVFCHLQMEVLRTNGEKEMEVRKSIERDLDKVENDLAPTVHLHANSLHFGEVRFGMPQTTHTVLENIGKNLVQFSFRPGPDGQCCKPWLSINPRFGFLMPEESVHITMRVEITANCAWALNAGTDQLDEVLVLNLENGGALFINVTGDFKPTVFGNSLTRLVCLANPIRDYNTKLDEAQLVRRLSVPKELWRMCDFVYAKTRGDQVIEGLFQSPGAMHESEAIREALDTGAEFSPDTSVHAMAETIVTFLGALEKPVISTVLYKDVMLHYSNESASKQIIMELDPVHFNTFVYLFSFLRAIMTSQQNLTSDAVAAVFSEVLMRDVGSGEWGMQHCNVASLTRRAQFLSHFLT
eukprot:c18990_g1_i3.p1 GENE.c18990_g1_i3~~c18990_g1_i3.p1  ORF type:complete len:849 (+),score=195.30 c18990_g1_i3:319-2547(+)